MTEQTEEDLEAFQTMMVFQNLAKLSSPMPLYPAEKSSNSVAFPLSNFKWNLQFSCYVKQRVYYESHFTILEVLNGTENEKLIIDVLYFCIYNQSQEKRMTVISADSRFEWDSEKNEINKEKHGLAFEEIIDVFDDPYFLERYDYMHSDEDEDRMIGIGTVNGIAVVTTAFTERQRIRLISARFASPKEEKVYYEYCKRLNS